MSSHLKRLWFSDNPRSIPELDAAKVEPSLTLPPYDRQWVPLSDLPLRDRTGSSMRRRKDSGGNDWSRT